MKTVEQSIAIQRLTALWAFGECGLGGVMHALKIPFTGLLVGSIAIICITMIGLYSRSDLRQIFRSLLIVLVVKAVVSPHTPFPAYIAVSFQALLAYLIFRSASVNFFTIMTVSIVAMIESAVQKLLLLTLFFGKTFWSGMDEFLVFITRPFGVVATNGSNWIIGAYLIIYLAGGIYTGWIAWRLTLYAQLHNTMPVQDLSALQEVRTGSKKKFGFLYLLIIFSAILLLPAFSGQSTAAVLLSLIWTISAIGIWYFLLSPYLTRLIHKYLRKQRGEVQDQAAEIISFLPVLQQLTLVSWRMTSGQPVFLRLQGFIISLFAVVIAYQKPQPNKTI